MSNFQKLGLYPHNIEAAKKVKEQFDEGAKTTSIIHATGTGKTYIALYLAMEYKNEKIIWLVPSNSIKEHIEKTIKNNPNISMERDFPNLEIRTYQSLINLTKKEIEEISCSLLITDEFHHLGAPVWGERVNTFIDTHEKMKIFGMTAYSIRDRGTIYERDMTNPATEEIFSDTVESIYDLYDAMIDGVLPKPITKSVITEDSEIILEIKDKIEMLKRKGDKSYLEYEKMLSDIVKIIHKQNGVKELIQQSVKPGGKYIYFCPVQDEKGKNDIETIMETIKIYLQEKYPNQNIVFYRSTSADENQGKRHRNCFYYDKDLDGNDARDAIKIIFVKNQYNEGVHSPNVDGVFLGRRTRSDIVAFEQIGRALSVRGNTHEKIEEYSHYDIEKLKELANQRGILVKETDTKQQIIEKLISPIIIDLADNIDFIQELETNLGNRIREIRAQGESHQRIIRITDSNFDIDVINKDLFEILGEIRTKLNGKTWDDWYNLALIYYQHHGNSEIPHLFKTINGYEYNESGVGLGSWCHKQRYNQDKLSNEKRKKLEAIGFIFEIKVAELEWEKKYNLALKYYQYHGNSEIPHLFKTINGYDYDAQGIKLGIWCTIQRKKQDKLTEERRQKLEAIEFRFDTKVNRLKWEEWYNLALIYYQHHGNSEIPNSFKTKNGYEYDETGFNLGAWCTNQRSRKNELSEEKIKKLEAIEFRFENKITQLKWDDWYNLALIYYQHHGNSEIPQLFKTTNGYDYDADGVKLGSWFSRQRIQQDKLTEERRKKLEAIGFRFENKKIKLEWEEWYNLALIYYQHYGNSEIVFSFKTTNGYEYDKTGFKLGKWCADQRNKRDKLSEERRKKLEAIEFRFENKITRLEWEEWYNLALIYYQHHGNSEIPQLFKTTNGYEYDETGFNLGTWCAHQRKKQDKLTEERRKKLEAIEFRFDTKVTQLEWEEWYNLALIYYQHHGNSEIPRLFKTTNGYEYDETGFNLGTWCTNQRSNQDKLTEERRKKLEAIEFRFIKKTDEKTRKIVLCSKYGINYNKHKFLNKLSYQELYAKIMYLIERNYPLEVDGKLHEIFTMSNENMRLKYHISKEEIINKYYIETKERGL